jgi:hypothetical protein
VNGSYPARRSEERQMAIRTITDVLASRLNPRKAYRDWIASVEKVRNEEGPNPDFDLALRMIDRTVRK